MKIAGHHGAADHHHGRRARGQRGLLRKRAGAGREPASARRTRAGPTPSTCSATSAPTSPASARSKRELQRLKDIARQETKNGRPLLEDPLFAARSRAGRDRPDGAGDHQPARALRGSAEARARPRGVDPQDQGHRGAAGAERADDVRRRALCAALSSAARARKATCAASRARPTRRRWRPRYFNYRKVSIYGGSNEIQRNIISQMILGL